VHEAGVGAIGEGGVAVNARDKIAAEAGLPEGSIDWQYWSGIAVLAAAERVIERQSAEMADLSRCVEVRDAQLTAANAEIERLRNEKDAAEKTWLESERDYNSMWGAAISRAEAAEARCKALEAGAIVHEASSPDGLYHMITKVTVDQQRDYRDRLDRMVAAFISRHFVPALTEEDMDWFVKRAALQLAAIDAKCEEGR